MLGRLLAGVLVGVAAMPAPASAAPPSPTSPSTASGSTASPSTAENSPEQALTLITGDTVRIGRSADGRHTASVTPAPGRERVTFHTLESDGGLRVLPSDAIPLVRAGRVDAELFDVERLLAEGYGDAANGTLPLIVSGGAGLRAAGNALSSIGAVAVRPAKDSLADFWKTQTTTARMAGEQRIFLDGRVKPVLDRSAAQIGAPDAWAAGLDGRGVKVAVLDTGVDAGHPDLAGRIAGTANFSSSTDVVDRFGHGTHVAATVAGSGAASGGTRKGVAYGAQLLIGKVLGDDGYGYESEIIAGMQWAVDSGAKVVNMSLGGSATDGLDPMSLALDELSASSGVLFVVAAGNEGAASSVGTPGAAGHALTVGAVDRENRIASFSSRGPRLGDLGLKPEITAPGVGIVAARAAGTTMGEPVDANYTAADGTSMATPHVAGAAAILAQQHPDWTGDRIKETLVSTAVTSANATVYDQGAGRVDLTRATTQRVTATPVADFGRHLIGEAAGRVTRTVEYRNAGSTAVTLALTAPAAVTLSAATVSVPAGGRSAVTVTLDLTKAKPAQISGWLTATATGVRVTTAVGGIVDGPAREVTVRAVDRDGKPIGVPALTIFGDDGRFDILGSMDSEGATVALQDGTYILTGLIELPGPGDEVTFVVLPELEITGNTAVLLDARKGEPIVIETPKPAEQRSVLSYYAHRVTGSGRSISHGVMHFAGTRAVNTVPTAKVRKGSFEFSSRWQLAAPAARADGLDLHMIYDSPASAGTRRYPVAEPNARNVRGKAVVLDATDEPVADQVALAAAGGAGVVVLVQPADRSAWSSWNPMLTERLPVTTVQVPHADGAKLRKKGTLTLTLTTDDPYLYDVFQAVQGQIPAQIKHRVTTANSMRVTAAYAHNGGEPWVREQRFGWRPWQDYSWNDSSRSVRTPSVREEWVSAGDTVWQHMVHSAYPWNGFGQLRGGFVEKPVSYRAGRRAETWGGAVVRPADLGSTRAGDVLRLRVVEFVDGDGHGQPGDFEDGVTAKLWRDGTLIHDGTSGIVDVTSTPGKASYKFKVTTGRSGAEWVYGTSTDSEWTFTSAEAGALPLLRVDYRVLPLGVKIVSSAELKSLKVEISTDDGRVWRPALVTGGTALVRPGKSPVSLRVTATDTTGNTLKQTVIRAYGRG
ncbi:S8 family serine peptidase [Actinoplanes derwentensis]|uniref:Serine protease, subtilisin family n=1 Tax=Actinoplanes derwentensis TaxID=113562 RepID=A0A1H2D3W2_9ACTN|nr:S8 family serine peptidase [Actinoplanes derwentensis]GID88312.1 peptidase [Actinoplanes derwentensis]SDT77172.1 Serine protease, subtilisin family [Actinoplanes derwentensis]